MAKFVIKDAVIDVNGVDLSDHCSSCTIETTTDEVDVTAFTTAGFREFTQGFRDANITATFFQDFAASSVDATLWPLSAGGTFAVNVRSSSGSVSATNPKYSLPVAKMYGYTPIGGGVGDASTTDVTFRNAGTAGLTRGTT